VQVCLLDSSLSAFSALSIMAANQQLAVPVWDAHADSYLGMLTVTDLVEIVLACRNSKTYGSCLEGLKVYREISMLLAAYCMGLCILA
jgi:hypothetical protein